MDLPKNAPFPAVPLETGRFYDEARFLLKTYHSVLDTARQGRVIYQGNGKRKTS